MKYSKGMQPIVCMQTQSTCYRGTKPMTVRGVLWHSTGANNPNLSRYVQPSDDAPDREAMLELLGRNKYNNDINHITRQMGVNAWIGKLADGKVATVQAMPWNWKPWGCGNGGNGSCNDGWIQFEICEDALADETYAKAAYREACELTAYLCRMFGLDPHGTVSYKGVDVPVILCHRDSHLLGLGNNHGDIAHWFPRYELDMTTAREDVALLLGEDISPAPRRTLRNGCKGEDVREMQQKLLDLGYYLGRWGADGDFGAATENAVMQFQDEHGLSVDGIVGPKTWAALDATTPQPPAAAAPLAGEPRYAVTVRGLTKAEADGLAARWPGAEVKEE